MPGIHQRLRSHPTLHDGLAAAHRPFGQSNLATRLLLQWGAGQISSQDVQKTAHAAVSDGLVHPEVVQLAAVGCWGEQRGNINRDLKRLFPCDYLPAPLLVRVPYVPEKTLPNAVHHVDCAIMLPHLWVAAIAKTELQEQALGQHLAPSFWEAVRHDDPRLLAKKKTYWRYQTSRNVSSPFGCMGMVWNMLLITA